MSTASEPAASPDVPWVFDDDTGPGRLRDSVARQLAQRKSQGLISEQDEQQMLETVASVLSDYTYLK